jgi:hypothetical protein
MQGFSWGSIKSRYLKNGGDIDGAEDRADERTGSAGVAREQLQVHFWYVN